MYYLFYSIYLFIFYKKKKKKKKKKLYMFLLKILNFSAQYIYHKIY